MLEVINLTSGKVAEATYYLNIMTLFVTFIMIFTNHRLIQWDFAFACGVPWFIMNVAGSYILTGNFNYYLKIILGVVLIIVFIQQTMKINYRMTSGQMLEEKVNVLEAGDHSGSEEIEEVISYNHNRT